MKKKLGPLDLEYNHLRLYFMFYMPWLVSYCKPLNRGYIELEAQIFVAF